MNANVKAQWSGRFFFTRVLRGTVLHSGEEISNHGAYKIVSDSSRRRINRMFRARNFMSREPRIRSR